MIPPDFNELKDSISNFERRLSTLMGRYLITATTPPTSSAAIQHKPSQLEILIARTNAVTTCRTDRRTQQDVFALLVNELREVLQEGNKEKYDQATMILLGALLHRYFRVIDEYKTHNDAAQIIPFGLFKCSIKDCKLFVSIRQALQLPKEMPRDYLTQDLKKLDVATIVTALECFQNHMLFNDHYLNFPHFSEDEHFKSHLRDIINKHKPRSVTVLNQFKAITFLQGIVKLLSEEQQQYESELDSCHLFLKNEYPDFSSLSIELIDTHIKAQDIDARLKQDVRYVLYTPEVQDIMVHATHESFISTMKKCNYDLASYIVMGACVLILESRLAKDNLIHCTYQVLGIEKAKKSLTDADKLAGVNLFREWIDDNALSQLDAQFFGGAESFKTELENKYKELIDRKDSAELERTESIEGLTA
jgi:hypothetical protein